MIRVTIDVVPFGIESSSRQITEIIINNDGTGTNEKGNYNISIYDETGEHRSSVKGFNRNLGALQLLKKALKGL